MISKKIKLLNISSLLIISAALSFLTSGCSNKTRTIELSFQLMKDKAFNSSDQMIVWLEKPDGAFVKTLFVSDYMGYGGSNLNYICPDWSGRMKFKDISKEEFDAITGATPDIGKVKLEFEMQKDSIPDGEYKFLIEVHLAEKYNELYSATINLSNKRCIRNLSVTFVPEKYSKATGDHLTNVKISCK